MERWQEGMLSAMWGGVGGGVGLWAEGRWAGWCVEGDMRKGQEAGPQLKGVMRSHRLKAI